MDLGSPIRGLRHTQPRIVGGFGFVKATAEGSVISRWAANLHILYISTKASPYSSEQCSKVHACSLRSAESTQDTQHHQALQPEHAHMVRTQSSCTQQATPRSHHMACALRAPAERCHTSRRLRPIRYSTPIMLQVLVAARAHDKQSVLWLQRMARGVARLTSASYDCRRHAAPWRSCDAHTPAGQ